MPAVKIYKVSVTDNNHSYVQWTDCSGYIPPPQLINSRLKSISFEAQVGSISKSLAATTDIIGDGNPDCSGAGNSENLITTTTSAPIVTTSTTTTTLAPSTTLILRYDAIAVSSACTGTTGTYYVKNNNQFVNTTQLFTNSGLTSIAPNGYYSDGTDYAIVSYRGVLSDKASCISATTTSTTSTTSTTTTTTTAAPTTTTTSTSTTTTTTVSAVPVEFAFTAPCLSNQATPTILWDNISGGSGVYQASSVVHTSAANALAGAFSDIPNGTDVIYPVITTNGTYFVAVRDKNNTSNVTNEAVVISCITGTTSTTTTTTTSAPATSTLYVYAYDSGAAANLILYAGVNGGAGTTIYDESIDGNMPSVVCGLIYTFTATLAPGDTVTFSTNLNCIMAGDDSASCPSATGGDVTFTTAVMVAGQNYVALGLNSSISP